MTQKSLGKEIIEKPEISKYALAMFDILGFSAWLEDVGIQTVLDTYHTLIERVLIQPNEKGGMGAVQTPDGAYLVVSRAPEYAYGSDTLLMWCPLMPELVGDFIERCSDLMCEALAMNIPLRGAITLGDAVLDRKSHYFLGEPMVEAEKLEKGQEWVGLMLGNSAVWSPFLTQIHGTSVIEYKEIPIKEEKREKLAQYISPIVVDWPRRWRDKYGECPSKKLEELRDPDHALKWDNTIKFVKFSKDKNDWHLRPDEIQPDAVLRLVSRNEAKF
jgi:hypothetical protein